MTPLVEKYRPSTLADFIGLERPRAILDRLATAPYASAWLLLGPSGLGKTTSALAVAEAIGGQLHHIPSQACNVERVAALCDHCRYYPIRGRFHVCIVDEADQMSRAAQLAFLSVLDGTQSLPDTIFLFTANDTKLLAQRFLSRLRTISFGTPGTASIAALLKRIYRAEGGRANLNFTAIAQAAGGNIRSAIMAIELELVAPDGSACTVNCTEAKADSPDKLSGAATAKKDPRLPPPGAVLVRKFKGQEVAVEVLATGFRFENRHYSSLSAVAREVAGANWNGYSFFGLNGAGGAAS